MEELDRTVTVRVTNDTRSLIRHVCRLRHEHVTTFIRRSILMEFARLGFMQDEQKKALGILLEKEKEALP